MSTTAKTVILQQVQWDEWQVGKCKNVIYTTIKTIDGYYYDKNAIKWLH